MRVHDIYDRVQTGDKSQVFTGSINYSRSVELSGQDRRAQYFVDVEKPYLISYDIMCECIEDLHPSNRPSRH